jgi:hypothetical protein
MKKQIRYDIEVWVETGVTGLPGFWATAYAYGTGLTESEARIALAQCRNLIPELTWRERRI